MKYRFLLCLILITAWSCGPSGESTETIDTRSEEAPTIESLPPDTLRDLYQKYAGAREDFLPTQRRPEVGKLNPVDEAPLDTAFFIFREQLLEAVWQKDVFHLLESTDENIKCSFGTENGIPDFVKMWQLDSPETTKTSDVWPTLENILLGGGAFSNNRKTFTAPYVFAIFPDDKDGFEYGAVTGSGVRLRDQPSLQSNVVTTVSYNIVKVIKQATVPETIGDETHPWLEVELLDGTKGYIFGQFVGQPVGWRAIFSQNEKGQWRMVTMVAGD